MKTIKLNLGKKELAIVLSAKRGRPKKTPVRVAKNFVAHLKKVYRDNRFTGNKASRVLRRIFEIKKIKEAIGLNLALMTFFSGAIGNPSVFTSPVQSSPAVLAANTVQTTTKESIKSPLESFQISQKYSLFHQAIDLKENRGAPVYPIMEGIVEKAVVANFGYGCHIIINHGSGFRSLYAHLQKIQIREGENVNQETVLGTVGVTGWSTGPHLHLEVWKDNQPINPLPLF